MSLKDEEKEHDEDKNKIKELLSKYSVDLVVVGANKLEARRIKEVLENIASNMKSYGDNEDEGMFEDNRKEAFVAWGSLEVPKLFATSHKS
jgi:RNase H-fold protein (predicted Holliday junction resolvase)